MRSHWIPIGVFVLLSTAPLALADPLSLLREAVDDAQPSAPGPAHGSLELAERAMEDALPQAPSPVQPIVAPIAATFDWLTPAALVGLTAAFAVAGTMFFFYGGARFVTPAEVLQNDVRQGIYAYLKRGVGANLKQLTDDLHLTTTNAIWHLRKLEDAGLIHSRRFNGYKVFYPAEGGIEARRTSLAVTALSNENAREVFQHVFAHPGIHQREIARALTVNHGTVRWHLKKLMDAEVITEERRGKTSTYNATPTGVAALRHLTAVPASRSSMATPLTAASSS